MDDFGTLIVSSATININGGTLDIDYGGQLNVSSDSVFLLFERVLSKCGNVKTKAADFPGIGRLGTAI